MRVHVRKWGNSASVRLPASVMAAGRRRLGQTVDVREEEGRVVIEPIALPVFDLDELPTKLDPATFPEAVDFGPPVGEEIW